MARPLSHEVLKTGDDDIVTANILVGADGKALTSTYCGTCGGVSVGCVDCPNNDPALDCETAQFTALPKRTEGGRVRASSPPPFRDGLALVTGRSLMTGPTVRHLLDVSALLQIVSGTKELDVLNGK